MQSPALRTVLVEVYMYGGVAEEIREAFQRQGFRLHNADAVTWKPGTAQNLIFTRRCEVRSRAPPGNAGDAEKPRIRLRNLEKRDRCL